MPLFSRFKNKGAQPTSKGKTLGDLDTAPAPKQQTRWQSRWESTVIVPEEIKELVNVCTAEMKSRAEALDAPFLLLPFRPDSDPQGARAFIRNFYKSNAERSSQYTGDGLKQELRLTDSVVLCGILKWCWSRMPNGVVSWPVYEVFRIGEKEANLARNAFDTFIPIGADSEARRSVIFDFFDLIAAVAAHGKMNGLTGRKVSRLAGWWAFEHTDSGNGFEGGYKSWAAAADAASHLFFAYLRSQSPDTDPSMNVIERIPRSLQALVASTEYPPETPTLLQRATPRVVMLVDQVSPTPFALLRRAKHFEYRDRDRVLREYSEYEDPIDALTDECKRVLYAVSSANQSIAARSRQAARKPEESWTAFQNLGFADIDEKALTQRSPTNGSTKTVGQGLREQPQSRNADAGRPTTPSWADFLSSGFADDGSAKSPALLYPSAHVLPPISSGSTSPSPLAGDDENLAPGELAAITNISLDDAFWWVWMTSLAGEEPSARKAVFGRCALIETSIMGGRWLIMEEQVKGAAPDPTEGVYIAPKKSIFSFTKRGRLGRKRSTSKQPSREQPQRALSATPSKTSITTDQQAKIKAAARALTSRKQETPEPDAARRGRHDDGQASKTNSMLTLGLQSEAGPAMKWASSYDKSTIRAQYLGDSFAGKGMSREDLRRISSLNPAGDSGMATPVPPTSPAAPAFPSEHNDRELPPVSKDDEKPASNESLVPESFRVSSIQDTVAAFPDVPSTQNEDDEAAPSPEVRRTAPESLTALDKEIGASPKGPKMGRKPVPRQDEHPAFRAPENDYSNASPTTPKPNAAALAAARAMQSQAATSPEESSKSKKPAGQSGGGIRKLFGKKKESTRGDSLDMPRPGSNGLARPAEIGIGRRLSLMRKKPTATPMTSTTAVASQPEPEMPAQEPTVTAQNFAHDHSPAELSRSSTHEHEAAEREFSRFDQGPMDDMPSAMPHDTSEEPSPQLNQHHFNTLAAARLHPQATEDATMLPFDAPASDVESEVTMEDNQDTEVVQDRWATIRENAHKRAAQRREDVGRPSEDQSTQSKASQSLRTDDGETSGEETIESRVARIKARVAELTGNMDAARQ
ncbi:related to morphogenesis-related MSB1 [Lecanosticta acicola]|uniref:Related to morphogenesis-related MSB1 n=1 Tax=Lecanosticta acicola TaxID=111012 RepID=A0AAI9EBI6_9PEZI|nr:related to morphogenesis-related MSB1 [Lecanosticta acicola]